MQCGMSQEKLLEVVKHCLAGVLQRFWTKCTFKDVLDQFQQLYKLPHCFLWVAHPDFVGGNQAKKGKLFF